MILRRISERIYPFGLFSIAMLSTALFAAGAWFAFSATIDVPSRAELAARFDVRPYFAALVNPEPIESAVFATTLTAGIVFYGLAGYVFSNIITNRILLASSSIAAVCALSYASIWLAFMDWTSILSPRLSRPISIGLSDAPVFIGLSFLIGVGILIYSFTLTTSRLKYFSVPIVAIPLLAISKMVLVGNDDPYIASTHYEVFAYPIVQDWLGQGIYLGEGGQKSQYGLYPLFLHPLWYVSGGPTTAAIVAVMAVLLFLSNGALIIFMARFSRHAIFSVMFAFLGIIFAMLQYHPFWPYDTFFQFFPIRLVFPALAMAFLCCRPTREDFQFLSYVILSFGLFWNFESAVVALAIYATFVLTLGFTHSVPVLLRSALRHLAMIAGGMAIATGVIFAIYLLRFEALPDLRGPLESIRAFSGGLGALPMPLFGAWGFHVLTYGASIFIGIAAIYRETERDDRLRTAALLAMAVGGLVWLRYYQGRSVSLQLSFVTTPAICCAGLMLDRAFGARRQASRICGGLGGRTAYGVLSDVGS